MPNAVASKKRQVGDLPRFLTADELAVVLGVHVKRVYEHAEELGGVRVGSQWRFRSDALPGGPRALEK